MKNKLNQEAECRNSCWRVCVLYRSKRGHRQKVQSQVITLELTGGELTKQTTGVDTHDTSSHLGVSQYPFTAAVPLLVIGTYWPCVQTLRNRGLTVDMVCEDRKMMNCIHSCVSFTVNDRITTHIPPGIPELGWTLSRHAHLHNRAAAAPDTVTPKQTTKSLEETEGKCLRIQGSPDLQVN